MTDTRKKHYKECTDEIFLLYECFQESGFDKDQAFGLVSIYVRQSMFDNIADYKELRRRQKREIVNQFNKNISEKMNKKTMGEQVCGT